MNYDITSPQHTAWISSLENTLSAPLENSEHTTSYNVNGLFEKLSTIEEERGNNCLCTTTPDDEYEDEQEGNENMLTFENGTKTEIILPRSKNRQNLFIIHNEIQSSSCVFFYLQFTKYVPNYSALLETFFQTVRERLTSSMRYV